MKTFKVVKIGRVSAKHTKLATGLTLDQAKNMVNCFADSSRSMVVFYKELKTYRAKVNCRLVGSQGVTTDINVIIEANGLEDFTAQLYARGIEHVTVKSLTENSKSVDLNEYLTAAIEVSQLTKDGKILFTGTENECYYELQRVQSQSADWAMKYEGYKISPVNSL